MPRLITAGDWVVEQQDNGYAVVRHKGEIVERVTSVNINFSTDDYGLGPHTVTRPRSYGTLDLSIMIRNTDNAVGSAAIRQAPTPPPPSPGDTFTRAMNLD
jgi:hypothetical protein